MQVFDGGIPDIAEWGAIVFVVVLVVDSLHGINYPMQSYNFFIIYHNDIRSFT